MIRTTLTVDFEDYDRLCAYCGRHDVCHNGSIDYDKVEKCKREMLSVAIRKTQRQAIKPEIVVFS